MSRYITFASAVVILGLAAPALAHVTIRPDSAAAGSYFTAEFVVPHGCDGSSTVAVRVKIPDGVTGVKPQLKPGWVATVKTRNLDAPVKTEHGRTVSETVDEVEWRGGPLPDNFYDTFGLIMKLPDAATRPLYFPTIQECEQGVHRWIDIPASGQYRADLHEPAPALKLTPKSP